MSMMRLLTALAFAACAACAGAQSPRIAAAADLKYALTDLAADYRRETGHAVTLSFGSSGNFAQQIANGAPFELFLSADEGYIDRLAAEGLAVDTGVVYAVGRLVLFVPWGSPLKPDPSLADLRAALADGRLKRFAIANPDVAPYGRAAREALQSVGIWDSIRPRLVIGENVSQATQFAAGGDAQGGIVASALARSPDVAKLGTAALISDRLHRPLRQRMALLRNAGDGARAFYRWLQSPQARAVFARHGFALPGES